MIRPMRNISSTDTGRYYTGNVNSFYVYENTIYVYAHTACIPSKLLNRFSNYKPVTDEHSNALFGPIILSFSLSHHSIVQYLTCHASNVFIKFNCIYLSGNYMMQSESERERERGREREWPVPNSIRTLSHLSIFGKPV